MTMRRETTMNTARYIKFIHTMSLDDRRIIETPLFGKKSKLSLLHFVGAPDYFITEFGAVFYRKKLPISNDGRLTRGYLPLVFKDKDYPYPWVNLYTSSGRIWFPVNQLLGWAFDPQKDMNKPYYLSRYPGTMPMDRKIFDWSDKLPVESTGMYATFMKKLYEA